MMRLKSHRTVKRKDASVDVYKTRALRFTWHLHAVEMQCNQPAVAADAVLMVNVLWVLFREK